MIETDEIDEIMVEVDDVASGMGIKANYRYNGSDVIIDFYIDNPKKLEEDSFYLSGGKAVKFEPKTGDIIGTSTISRSEYDCQRFLSIDISEKYSQLLDGIESEEDYIDEEDYAARFLMESRPPYSIWMCNHFLWYIEKKLYWDFRGNFWRNFHGYGNSGLN